MKKEISILRLVEVDIHKSELLQIIVRHKSERPRYFSEKIEHNSDSGRYISERDILKTLVK